VEKQLVSIKKKSMQDKTLAEKVKLLEKVSAFLNDGKWLADQEWTAEEIVMLPLLQLLSTKPMSYILNVDEDSAVTGNDFTRAVEEAVTIKASKHSSTLVLSAKLEADASEMGEGDEMEFLADVGLKSRGIERVVGTCARLLNQHYFYTVGPQEARSWVINIGSTAAEAAGKIHTDMQTGFIKADCISLAHFLEHGEDGCKAKNLVRLVNKDYIVQDGDVMLFKFQPPQAKK
jgi:hypothetical protein